MDPETYIELKDRIVEAGYGHEIEWSLNIKPCASADEFWTDYGWTVMCSGMKEQVVRPIWDRIRDNLMGLEPDLNKARGEFGHKGKMEAILSGYIFRADWFKDWQEQDGKGADAKVDWLCALPWIGKITCYHLAKNLGMDVCKPDRHLVRIAELSCTTPWLLCVALSTQIGDPVRTVDTVLWRAANLGFV